MAQKKGLTKDEIARIKEFAKMLYVEHGITNQEDLASRAGTTLKTINKWINEDNGLWKRLRESHIVTKTVEIRRLYAQVTELNDAVEKKPVGERYLDSKQSDIMVKTTAAIKQLEIDSSAADAMNVFREFLPHLQRTDPEAAKFITPYCDHFVKHLVGQNR